MGHLAVYSTLKQGISQLQMLDIPHHPTDENVTHVYDSLGSEVLRAICALKSSWILRKSSSMLNIKK